LFTVSEQQAEKAQNRQRFFQQEYVHGHKNKENHVEAVEAAGKANKTQVESHTFRK
jgi:hypothetical protein